MEHEDILFSEIIIEDAGSQGSDSVSSNGDKNNKSLTKTKRQLEILCSFVHTNGDFTKGKASEDQLAAWDNLTDELNGIGPPYHTNLEWRKIWSGHKGNLKRKSSTPSTVVKPKVVKAVKAVQSSSRCIEVQCEELDEDDKENKNIHSMLNGIVNKIDSVVEKQMETNELLRELIGILKPQSVDYS